MEGGGELDPGVVGLESKQVADQGYPWDWRLVRGGPRGFWESWKTIQDPRFETLLRGGFDEALRDDGEDEDRYGSDREDDVRIGGIHLRCDEQSDRPTEQVHAERDVAEFGEQLSERRGEAAEKNDEGWAEEREGEVGDACGCCDCKKDDAGDEACGPDGPASVESEEEGASAEIGRGFIEERIWQEHRDICGAFPIRGSEPEDWAEERDSAECEEHGGDATAGPEDQSDGKQEDVVDDFVRDGPEGAVEEVAHLGMFGEGEGAAGDVAQSIDGPYDGAPDIFRDQDLGEGAPGQEWNDEEH